MKIVLRGLVALSLAVGFAGLTGCQKGSESGSGSGGVMEGGEIILVGRQNNSGTYAYFKEEVLGKEGEFKLDVNLQNGSKDVVELVAKTPNAIGYSGMGYATPEIKMLAVSKEGPAVAPSTATALDGTYPLARPLYIYTLGEPEGAVKAYIDWIMSKAGQKVVEDIGYVPAPGDHPDAPTENPGQATISVSGSDTMVNLAQKWAEVYTGLHPGVKPEVSGGGSGVGIANLMDGVVQMANSSREIKAEEREKAEAKSGKKVMEFKVGLDALAIYVHKDNPLNSISMAELKEIYGDGGTIDDWSKVTGWPSNGK